MATYRKHGSNSLLPRTEQQRHVIDTSSRFRLHHLDNLRIFLICLVIVHHTAIPYGGLGSWNFHSPCFPIVSAPLAIFNAVDQTFFMALFYWMAGYFTYLELSRRGTAFVARRDFICNRVRRLVLPSIFFTLFLEPMLRAMSRVRHCALAPSQCDGKSILFNVLREYVAYWYEVRGIEGPVWFCALLAIFDAVAAILSPIAFPTMAQVLSPQSLQTPKGLAKVLGPVIFFTFLLRSWYPIGAVFDLLNLQPAFLVQYVFAYTTGHASAAAGVSTLRFPTFSNLINPLVNPLRTLAIAIALQTLSLGIVLLAAYAVKGSHEAVFYIIGGINLPSFLCTVWNEIGFITIGPAIVDVFAKHFQQPLSITLPWRKFTIANTEVKVVRYAFAAFLVHPVVSLAVEFVAEWVLGCEGVDARMKDWDQVMGPMTVKNVVGPVVVTAVVGGVNVVVSWMVAMGALDVWPELGSWV